jgi:small-conductance mechanosensitive channel
LIADTPFRTGDLITLPGDKIYRVDKIGLRTTTLYSYDEHSTTYIPNRTLTNDPIENITKPTVELRLAVEVGVGYNSDLPHVERVLKENAWAHPNVLGSDLDRKRTAVRAELARVRALGQDATVEKFERALAKMEREHLLLDRVREFDDLLGQLAAAISTREERGLSAAEIRELNTGYVAPANVLVELIGAALDAWRALPDPWANLDELEAESQRWRLRRERLERRWATVRDRILSPSVENTRRLDTLTQQFQTWLREEFKFPPEIWKDPTVNFLAFGASSVDVRLAYYIDDGRLEHFKRRTRLTRELAFTIHHRFRQEGIEIPFPQTDVWFRS